MLWTLVDSVYKDHKKDGPFYIGQIRKLSLREFNNTPKVTELVKGRAAFFWLNSVFFYSSSFLTEHTKFPSSNLNSGTVFPSRVEAVV